MLKNHRNKMILLLFLIFLFSTVTYSYPSAKIVLSSNEPPSLVDARDILHWALDTNQHSELAQKFWFNGWVKNYVQKRKTTSMFSGNMISPHGYYVDARMAGVPYRFYKWDDENYIWTSKDDWSRVEQEVYPFDPFAGFDGWLPLMQQAKQLPNEEVLSKNCLVYEVNVSGKDWIETSTSPLFEDIRAQIKDTHELDGLLAKTNVTMTIWIGDEQYKKEDLLDLAKKKGINTKDELSFAKWIENNRFVWDDELMVYHQHLIYQYNTLIHLPIPGAGYMDQEIYFRLYKYDDVGITMKTPDEMEQYVLKKAEQKQNNK